MWSRVLVFVSLTALATRTPGETTDLEISAGDTDLLFTPLWCEEGRYRDALQAWIQAAQGYGTAGETRKEAMACVQIARIQHLLGDHCDALAWCELGCKLAAPLDDPALTIDVKDALGVAHTFRLEVDSARTALSEALDLAVQQQDPLRQARVQLNLGNLRLAAKDYAAAAQAYAQCWELAQAATQPELGACAAAHRALAAILDRDARSSRRWNDEAMRALSKLPLSPQRISLLILNGRTSALIVREDATVRDQVLPGAAEALRQAQDGARHLGNLRLESYALGSLAELYLLESRPQEALHLCRLAIFAAQQLMAHDLLYLWEWQRGVIWRALNDNAAAIAALRRAVTSAEVVRNAMALGYWNEMGIFRSPRGARSLYLDLADLLIERAGQAEDPRQRGEDLRAARDTIDLFRAVEVEDYFRDECADLLRSQQAPLETIGDRTAVVYFIPFDNRTEVLITLGDEFERFTAPVGSAELETQVAQLRQLLEKRTTYEFLEPARELYQLLVSPMIPILAAQQVETLVFIPDAPLRGIPMAALHDGERFLAERYAIAVSPSLMLVDAKPIQPQRASLLASALSVPVQDLPALAHTLSEVEFIRTNFASHVLLNEQFRKGPLFTEFGVGQYSVVHFASHAHFDRDSRKTFLMTYDDRISLDDLERLIRPKQYRGRPVELLVLSACETAVGDDRAALGLAGVAVKSGARSALATLWLVDDEAAAHLMREFYSHLLSDPVSGKAKALRSAQLALLEDSRYRHPYYWSPYLVVGNWL